MFLRAGNLFHKIYNRLVLPLCQTRFLFIKNAYGTSFERHALLSYLPDPFINPGFSGHSNYQEILAICAALKEHEFNVDVIHFLDTRNLDYNKYSYILGFGTPFNKSHLVPCNAIRIVIATGAHYCFQTHAELQRIRGFSARTRFKARPRRINPNHWGESLLSEYMILTGNSWTMSTYEPYFGGKIFTIPVTAVDYYSGKTFRRNWDSAKKQFLWFGSSGLIHKGLDLCIEAFSKTQGMVLHICGPREDDCFEAYEQVFRENTNIRYHGFLDVRGDQFRELLQQSGFVILPSCSEGQAGSVITAMFSGLIPVVTRECGVDLLDFVYQIREIQIDRLKNLIQSLSEKDSDELADQSNQCMEYVLQNHTLNNYSEVFTSIFEQILYDKHDPN
ncbi:MAG: glycosyltransferase [Bacteroidetes bacterium]|nr:glycosyltransferase [Bacteroidota bacterium]